MTPWQILRAGRASKAAPGYRVRCGTGAPVLYSTAAAASAAPHNSRSFCLSREKLTLQQLNRRLASYLKQVRRLEATNQRLKCQIQEAQNEKNAKELDGHLKAASVLQDQITGCLSAQAHLKLLLLNAELSVFNLSLRCQQERERREHVERGLSNLRLQEEELQVHTLPELQRLLRNRVQQLMELQIQHRQNTKGLLAQVSGGTGVQMETGESSDLIQQRGDLRRAGVTQVNKNECCFNAQVSMLSSPDSSPEVAQAGLTELRRGAASLEEELKQLRTLNVVLEASGGERTESFSQQLGVLQQRAESLCKELDSVVQAAAQLAADHRILLDITSHSETEMQDYRSRVDELTQEGPAASRGEAPLDRSLTCSSEGGGLRIMENQRGHTCTSSQGKGALPKKIGRESMAMTSAMISGRRRPLEAHNKDHDLLKLLVVSAQISQDVDEIDVVQASKTDAQGSTMSLQDQRSARIASLLRAKETFTARETTKEMSFKANITEPNIQAETPKAKQGVRAELKQGLSDTGKQTAALLRTETQTVILAQTDGSNGSVQAKTPSEAVGNTVQIAVTPDKVPGPYLCWPKGPWFKVSSQLTIADKDTEAEAEEAEGTSLVLRLAQNSAPSDVTNSKRDRVTKVEDSRSGTPFSSPDSNGHPDSKSASTEILKRAQWIVNKKEVVSSFHETKEMNVTRTVHDLMNLAGQEALLTTTESKKSIGSADSGVALSVSDCEELSPRGTDVLWSPGTCVHPSSFKTEVEMSFTDQVFFPLHLENHIGSSGLLPSPNDPAMYLSTINSEKCSGPVETNRSLKSKEEVEDEETCLTEAKAHTRPVEKYILSTKVEGQSLSLSGEHAFPERNGKRRVTVSVTDGDSLCFGSFEDNSVGSRDTGGSRFRPSGGCSALAKNEPLDYDTWYWKSADAGTPGHKYKNTDSAACNEDVQSTKGKYFLETQKPQTPLPVPVGSVARSSGGMAVNNASVATDITANFRRTLGNSSGSASSNAGPVVTEGVQKHLSQTSGEWMVYSVSPGCKSSLDSGSCLSSKWTKEGSLMCALPAKSPQEIGGFGRRGSGEWMLCRSRRGGESSLHDSVSLLKEERGRSLSSAANPTETGRCDKRESGEWATYRGSFERKRSLDGGFPLLRTRSEQSAAKDARPATSQPGEGRFDSSGSEWSPVASHLATSPPVTKRFVNTGSGKWMIHGSGDSLPNTEGKECLPMATNLATTPPRTGRSGIRGSGEWKVYGAHTRHMSNLTGSNASAESKGSLLMDRQLATTSTSVVPGAGRFGTGGSGEWRVYGQSTGCRGSAGGANRVGVSVNEGQAISPPSSYTYRGQRLCGAGGGGRPNSRSVVRRSRSVGSSGRFGSSGSGGRLGSSPSNRRISSPGKFTGTGSEERKPVRSSASGRRSSVGSAGPSSGRQMSSDRTSPSPSGRTSVRELSSRWLSSSPDSRVRISSTGSSPGYNERVSSQANGGCGSCAGSGRTSSRMGRVINSSDRPVRNTGSGACGSRERMSICKMAALTISAAGRERSQERQRPAQHVQQHAGENDENAR